MEIMYFQSEIFAAVKVYIVVFWIMIYILRGVSEMVTTIREECAASYLG
jgi:cadmium resistance protein CadD (predicted permease)